MKSLRCPGVGGRAPADARGADAAGTIIGAVKIRQVGNGLGITLPKRVVDECGYSLGGTLIVIADSGGLRVIRGDLAQPAGDTYAGGHERIIGAVKIRPVGNSIGITLPKSVAEIGYTVGRSIAVGATDSGDLVIRRDRPQAANSGHEPITGATRYVKLRRVGNSIGITLPKVIAEECDYAAGGFVVVTATDAGDLRVIRGDRARVLLTRRPGEEAGPAAAREPVDDPGDDDEFGGGEGLGAYLSQLYRCPACGAPVDGPTECDDCGGQIV